MNQLRNQSPRPGLTRRMVLTNAEDEQSFAELFNSYWQLFEPADRREADVFNDIVCARWRLCRVWGFSNALLDMEMTGQDAELSRLYRDIDNEMRGASAFRATTGRNGVMHACIRFEEHLYRIYNRSTKLLRQMQKERVLQDRKDVLHGPATQ